MAVVFSAVATIVGIRFCVALALRWHRGGRRRPALLHWTISTAMFALASAMLFLGETAGWSPLRFRIFYVFGAVLNVPWLALGSILINAHSTAVTRAAGVAAIATGLLFLPGAFGGSTLAIPAVVLGLLWGALLLQPDRSLARRGSVLLVLVLSLVGIVAVTASGLHGALPRTGIPEGKELFGVFVRSLAVASNGLGAIIVIVGALASALAMSVAHTEPAARDHFRDQLRRRPVEAVAQVLFTGTRAARDAGVAHLAAGNLLIALGVLVAAGSGGMFSFLGDTEGHAIGLGGGAAIMYAGFVRTTRPTFAGAGDSDEFDDLFFGEAEGSA